MTPEDATPEIIRPQTVRLLQLHMLTFPEVLDSKRPVCDMRGYLVGGPDRKGANAPRLPDLWLNWQRDVQAAGRRDGAVPQTVMDYYQATKDHIKPPVDPVVNTHPGRVIDLGVKEDSLFDMDLGEGVQGVDPRTGYTMDEFNETNRLLNQVIASPKKKHPKPPRFATSYSGIKNFLNCPCQWGAAKYWKTLPYIEGPEAAWGNRVHLAMENVLNAKVIQDDIKLIKENGYEKYLKAIFQAKQGGASVTPEEELCLTKDLKPCGWKDWNTVWFRYKGDVHIVKGNKFKYLDWKTGRRFSKRGDDQADIFQLEVAWAIVSVHHPDIEEFTGALVFLQETDLAKVVVSASFTRADLPRIWDKILGYTNRMQEAWDTETFRMQTSGLCRKHCKNSDCPHAG